MKTIAVTLKMFLILTIITGIIYPVVITVFAQIAFPSKANGSLIKKNGIFIGSELIGQKFDSAIYFCSRPSAIDYNPLPSGGSNYGPTSKILKKQVEDRKSAFLSKNMLKDSTNIPIEMLFASASGLDPHISPQAALLQVGRIAEARHLTKDEIQKAVQLIYDLTEPPQFGLFGETRINVLKLNIALDNLKKNREEQ